MVNVSLFIGVLLFIAAFGTVFYLNSTEAGGKVVQFTPPYHYKVGEMISFVNAFLFVFIVSAAFFGFGVPIALGIEGLKFASLFSLGAMPAYDMLFAIPEVVVAYSAGLLAKGAVEDYRGKGNVFSYWKDALKWFAVAAFMLVVLILARTYF